MSDTIDERAIFGLLESNPLVSQSVGEEFSSARFASDIEEVRRALEDSRARVLFDSVVKSCDDDVSTSVGVEREAGTRAGQSRSEPAMDSRSGRSLASIKLRLIRDGLWAEIKVAIGRDGKGFSTRAR
jgi:hypothetical protein